MSSIHTIDCDYLGQARFAAAYLLVEGDRAAFIDNNTNAAVPALMAALDQHGLTPAQVEFIIVTHVHLDHAGATSTLASLCPQAVVVAHPRAATHIIDPSRLVASATAVYGEAAFAELYGTIDAVAESRVRSMADGEVLSFGQRELCFMHTRGHANHHVCIADSLSNSIFTGDAFGLHYPALQTAGPFALPSTSPTDFDGGLAREAIHRLMAQRPDCVYPTHFGATVELRQRADQVLRHLDFAEALMHEAQASDVEDEALHAYCEPRIRSYLAGVLDALGPLGSDPATWSLLQLDIDLNAQGIAFAANKRRRKAREADA